MKNIFKFMGIALMAGAMMVACNPENQEPEDTTPTPTPTPTPSTPTLTVKFGSDAQYNGEGIAAVGNSTMVRIFKEANSGHLPYTDICFANGATGSMEAEQNTTIVNEGTDSAYVSPTGQYSNENIAYIEYGETQQIQLGNSYYGDWLMKEGTLNVTSFDATNLKGTMTLNAQMFDFLGWLQGFYEYDEADIRSLTVNCTNYTFAAASKISK